MQVERERQERQDRVDWAVDRHHDLELFTTQVERERQERQDRVDRAVDRHHELEKREQRELGKH